MEIPPTNFRLGDLTAIDTGDLRGATGVDTSGLTKPARKNLFAQVFGVIWDQVADHADDALYGLATVVRAATGKGGYVVRTLGAIAAGLLELAADRIEGDTPSEGDG